MLLREEPGYALWQPFPPRSTPQLQVPGWQWLSQQTGRTFTLPTETQWEWACRAGTASDFWYGGVDTDFGRFANLADRRLAPFAWRDSPPWHPRDDRFDDGALVTQSVGRYEPNPWGLHDMHGNVAEWTRSEYRPYPYNPRDGRDDPGGTGPSTGNGPRPGIISSNRATSSSRNCHTFTDCRPELWLDAASGTGRASGMMFANWLQCSMTARFTLRIVSSTLARRQNKRMHASGKMSCGMDSPLPAG